MMASFCAVNLKGISGLLSAVLRCCGPPRGGARQRAVTRQCRGSGLEGQLPPGGGPGGAGEGAAQLTTMRVSLCRLAATENVRVWGASGRAARVADRAAVRRRKGVSLLAMAARVSSNGSVNRGVGVAVPGPDRETSSFEALLIGGLAQTTTAASAHHSTHLRPHPSTQQPPPLPAAHHDSSDKMAHTDWLGAPDSLSRGLRLQAPSLIHTPSSFTSFYGNRINSPSQPKGTTEY